MNFISENRKIILLLLLAFVVRFIGIWYGLPSFYNSDEPFNVLNALAMGARKSLEPVYFVYPAFYSCLLAGVYGLCYLVGHLIGLYENALDFGASYFIDPTVIFFCGRLLSVVLGVATIWLVYFIGKRFFAERTGLIAALLLSLSSLHVDWSHWILLEAAISFMSVLAIYFILVFQENPSWKHLLLASMISGLAISTKYNAGFLILSLWLAIFQSSSNKITEQVRNFMVATSVLVSGFILGSPYWLLAPEKYLHDLKYTVSHVGTGMVGHISGMPLVWPLWELIFNDLTIGLLFVAGFISVLFGGERKQYLLMIFVLPTLLLVGLWNRSGVHYIAPLFPALAILAAIFLNKAGDLKLPREVRSVLFAALLLVPLIKICYHDIRLTQADSRTEAKEWIEHNIPAHTKIAYENYVYGPNLFDPGRFLNNSAESRLLPLQIKEELVEESFRRVSYRLINLRKNFKLKGLVKLDSLNHSQKNSYVRQLLENRLPKLSSVRKASVPFVLISSDNYSRYFRAKTPTKNTPVWLSYQNGRRFYQSIFNNPDIILIKEFNPGKWNLGPTIRLYRIQPPR